ncbi:uncharacterized protein [Palaemon carinicauda]|uniref:uncharacterized protein n=1 Tax=Palaemon carinicauda TaxID=392227 RepID=UPI0035B5B109
MEEKKVLAVGLLMMLTVELITGTMAAAAENNNGLETTTSLSSSSYASPSSSDFPRSSDETGASQGSTSPSAFPSEENSLVCWSCSSTSHGNPCTNIDPQNSSAVEAKVCDPDEKFCSVKRIWYVVETKEAVMFSVNRNCSSECTPSCMVIGDRTKIHACTSCCTESHCNTDNSSSSRQTSNFLLLMSAFVVAIVPVLSISVLSAATDIQDCSGCCKSSKRHKSMSYDPSAMSTTTTSSDVFLYSRQNLKQSWRQNMTAVGQSRSLLFDASFAVPASVSSKSFDNF